MPLQQVQPSHRENIKRDGIRPACDHLAQYPGIWMDIEFKYLDGKLYIKQARPNMP